MISKDCYYVPPLPGALHSAGRFGSPSALRRPGIFEWRLFHGRWPQPAKHQIHGAEENHTFTGVGSLLVIFAITPVAANPGIGPLDHPTDTQGVEALGVRWPTADFHMPFPVTVLRQPIIIFVIVIFVVSKDCLQTRERLGPQFSHDFLSAGGIIHVPGGDDHGQKQTKSVHNKMTLSAIDLLGAIIPMCAATLGGLPRLTVPTVSTRSRFAHGLRSGGLRRLLPNLLSQRSHDFRPQGAVAPFGEIIVDGALGQ